MELFPYQVEGAKFLAARGRALLADEMGLGKSAQAIAAAVKVCEGKKPAGVVHVVCPASVVENWKREIKRFANSAQPMLWGVVSYNNASKEDAFDFDECDVLILDEAHYLKNHKAKRTKAIFGDRCDGAGGLVSRAKHVFLLTGTPTPNHPAELWPMLRAVMPTAISPRYYQGEGRPLGGRMKPLTYWQFVQKYCRTRDNGFGIQIVGGKNIPHLKEAIAPWVLRRKKEQVLADLPPIRFDELSLSAELKLHTLQEVRQLEEIEKALAEKGVDGLREIAPHVAQLRRVTGTAKVPAAIEWIKEQFEGGLKKLVVFAQHRDVIEALQSAFSFHVSITGETPASSRGHIVDTFQRSDAAKLFIGQIQAAGTGITLTAASDMLFLESSWVPAENEQAAMRIHRIGQRNACLVRFATLAGSIDEQIQRAVMRKTADIAKLFG